MFDLIKPFLHQQKFITIKFKTMKKAVSITILVAIALGGYAKKIKILNPICGTWKYTKGSVNNDFQHIEGQDSKSEVITEYFVFNSNNEFKHEFVNTENKLIKNLKGNWKLMDGKIKVTYTDLDFQLTLNYFFLDKDLVLGQNFNHVILSKDATSENLNNNNLASINK